MNSGGNIYEQKRKVKMCNRCGEKTDKTNDLSVREWVCEVCGNHNDRDINASLNIMFEGLKFHYC